MMLHPRVLSLSRDPAGVVLRVIKHRLTSLCMARTMLRVWGLPFGRWASKLPHKLAFDRLIPTPWRAALRRFVGAPLIQPNKSLRNRIPQLEAPLRPLRVGLRRVLRLLKPLFGGP